MLSNRISLPVSQRALQIVDMLSWPAMSSYLSAVGQIWDIIGRHIQRHPQPALSDSVLTDQVEHAWNYIPKQISGNY